VHPQAIKGHLDMLLLAVIQAGATHGYAIAEELRRASGGAFDLQDGTIYPALRRLEERGLVESTWDEGSGRRRRIYELTAEGRKQVKAQRTDWNRFERAVHGVLALRPQ
jgi:transcriptional regulator